MPWTEKQLKLFRAAAHNPAIAKSSGIKQSDAERMSKEGSKKMSTGGINQINQQQTRSGSINGARKRLPSVSLNKFVGLKSGGMMKTRKFAEAGFVDDSDMDDEGNTRSKYEIDPDSRRAHGLYNEAPAASKAASKATPANKSYRERFPQTEKAAYTPKEPIKQKTPAEQSRADMLQGEAEKRKITSTPFPTGVFKSKPSDVKQKTPAEQSRTDMLQGEAEKRKTKSVPFPTEGFKFKPSTYKTLKEKLAENRDTERGFKKGGMMKNLFKGKESYGEELKEAKAIKSGKISPQQYAKGEDMEKTKKYAKGGGIESRGKTKGTIIRMAMGGSVSSASRRADGIAQRGKTKC